jgi:superfamily II DNA or RNA helicase
MKIKYYNEAFVSIDCEYDEAQELSDVFSFYSPNHQWSPKYQSGIWDGKIHLFDINNCLLPFGLLKKLIGYLKLSDYEYEIEPRLLEMGGKTSSDEILQFCNEVLKADLVPRDYQIKTIQYFLYHQKMIGVSATASGKSFIYYILFNLLRYLYDDIKCLLLVPRTSLVEQMSSDFQEYAKNLCDFRKYNHRIYSGREKYTNKMITISTWQSLKNMPPEYFEKFNCVVVDEVHEATAKELPRIVHHCINAIYRVGMTGHLKDCKIAKMQLNGLLGNIKTFSKSAELIEKGYLSDIEIKCIILKYGPDITKKFMGRHHKEYVEENEIIRAISSRKKFLCQLAASRPGNTMILFKIRDYGRDLYRLIKRNFKDKKVFYIDGTVKVKYREKVRAVAEKYDDVIIVASYGTFSTGINIKNLHNLIFGESVLSSVKVIQSIGRLLRKYFNKNAKLYDVTDDLTYRSRRNYVLKHFLRRIKYYDQEQFEYDVTNKTI